METTLLKFKSIKDLAEFSRLIDSNNFIMVPQRFTFKAQLTKDEIDNAVNNYNAIVEELVPALS